MVAPPQSRTRIISISRKTTSFIVLSTQGNLSGATYGILEKKLFLMVIWAPPNETVLWDVMQLKLRPLSPTQRCWNFHVEMPKRTEAPQCLQYLSQYLECFSSSLLAAEPVLRYHTCGHASWTPQSLVPLLNTQTAICTNHHSFPTLHYSTFLSSLKTVKPQRLGSYLHPLIHSRYSTFLLHEWKINITLKTRQVQNTTKDSIPHRIRSPVMDREWYVYVCLLLICTLCWSSEHLHKPAREHNSWCVQFPAGIRMDYLVPKCTKSWCSDKPTETPWLMLLEMMAYTMDRAMENDGRTCTSLEEILVGSGGAVLSRIISGLQQNPSWHYLRGSQLYFKSPHTHGSSGVNCSLRKPTKCWTSSALPPLQSIYIYFAWI